MIAAPVFFLRQIGISTCIKSILNICIDIICGKGYFGVKYVFFSENHGKLEIKNNSVINGQIFIIDAFLMNEYLVLYLYFVFSLSRDQHNKKRSLK